MKRLSIPVALAGMMLIGGLGLLAVPLPSADAASRLAAQEADTYQVDPVHTVVIFGIEWGGMTPFYGQFTDYSGSVIYDGENTDSFACEVIIPVDSVDTHNEQRDRHLKSPDFFNGREFPNITFKGTELTKNDDGTHTLKGDLSLHGQTKPVEAKITRLITKETQQGNRCGLAAEMTIKRTDFGMDTMVGDALGDEVTLQIAVQSVRQ